MQLSNGKQITDQLQLHDRFLDKNYFISVVLNGNQLHTTLDNTTYLAVQVITSPNGITVLTITHFDSHAKHKTTLQYKPHINNPPTNWCYILVVSKCTCLLKMCSQNIPAVWNN